MALLSREALLKMGFASIGDEVFISDKASFYNAENIHIGHHVRIDDFCVLSAGEGGIVIGNYIHIAVGCTLIGKGVIRLADFCGLSSRVSLYSSSDDYSGAFMTNPMVPEQYTNVTHGDIVLEKHVIIGSGSVVLPNVRLAEGVAIGALSLVNKSCDAFMIYAGNPVRRVSERKRDLLAMEVDFLQNRQ